MVYGDFKKNKVSELDKLVPKEIYGTMKLAGEIVTKGLCKILQNTFYYNQAFCGLWSNGYEQQS